MDFLTRLSQDLFFLENSLDRSEGDWRRWALACFEDPFLSPAIDAPL